MKTKNTDPLISIIVLAFNSAKYILETLESIRLQTYQHIELIVSDDASSDDTVTICQQWLAANTGRFIRTELITIAENTGTTASCNRGLRASQGEWIKYIAGDDALLEKCIEINVQYANANEGINCIHSECEHYEDNFSPENFRGYFKKSHHRFCQSNITAKEQHHLLLNRNNGVSAPTVFMKTTAVRNVGGFDERMRLLEDTPLWIKLTEAGYKFYYLEEATAKYRMHSASIQRNGRPYMSISFANELIKFDRIYKQGKVNIYVYHKRLAILNMIIGFNKAGLNSHSLPSSIIFKILDKLLKIG